VQADKVLSDRSSFNPVGLSPSEINRFYAETGNPSTDPGYTGNGRSRPAAGPNDIVGIFPTESDRLYNFTQLGRSATAPSAVNGITSLNQTAPMPWYSSPDTGAPAVPFVSSDDTNFSGGLLGRFASLAGGDPNQSAPSPDDEQEQANLQALEDRLKSTGNINDASALYDARIASRR